MIDIKLADDTIQLFDDFTGLNIEQYLNDYTYFTDNNLQSFVNYYKGTINEIEQTALDNFNSLFKQSNIINNTIKQTIHNFIRNDFAYLFLMLDEIRQKLFVINKLSIFLRSSRVNATSNNAITSLVVLHNYETPENISVDKNDFQNSWTKTFIQNRIYQTDFTEENGFVIEQEQNQFNNLFLNNIIDNLNFDNLLGKDLDKYITFDTTAGDYVALGFDATFTQGIQILGNMMQGDHPYYRYVGQNPNNLNGNNYSYNLPFIIRDLQKSINTDDTIRVLNIDDIQIDGNKTNINASCTTIKNTIYSRSFMLQQQQQ